MSVPSVLDELDAWLAACESADLLDDATRLPAPPALDGHVLADADLGRAHALLERMRLLGERTEGQRTRLAGEIAALPKRRPASHRRSPSSFDRLV